MQNYPEKECRVFEGVLALAEGGADLRLLTVQDIARAAGIGKGTVYEYFSSKEEILAGTILYCIENELDEAEQAMERETTFSGCLEGLGRLLEEVLEQRLVRYHLIIDSLQRSGKDGPSGKYCEKVKAECGRIIRVANHLIALGRKDGKIRAEYTDEYCLFVLRSILPGLVLSCNTPFVHSDEQSEAPAAQQIRQALICAFHMLQRALG